MVKSQLVLKFFLLLNTIALFFFFVPTVGTAEFKSKLPPCPANGSKHNCYGIKKYYHDFNPLTFRGRKNIYTYVGEFRNNLRHGFGKMDWPFGYYEGLWKDDKEDGFGKYIVTEKNSILGNKIGNWKNGKLHGKATWYHEKSKGGKPWMTGEWKNGDLYNGYYYADYHSKEKPAYIVYKNGKSGGWIRSNTKADNSGGTPSNSITDVLKVEFYKLAKDNRVKVQLTLKKLHFYKSSIDGLYGLKTKNALEKFSKEKLNDISIIKNKQNAERLIKAVLDYKVEFVDKPKDEIKKKTPSSPKVENKETAKKPNKKPEQIPSKKEKQELSMFLCTSLKNGSQKLLQLPEDTTFGAIGDMAFRFQKKDSVFFGPSSDGTSFAKFSDNNLLITSAEDDWQGNCVRLQNDIAKTLKDRTGISSSVATDLNRNINIATQNNATEIREEFISLSRDKRKHVQAALKSRGLYKSTIDGLYGKNTGSAIRRYIDEEVSKNPSYQQKSIGVMLNELRNQFAYVPPKEKKIEKFETSKYTFNAIGSNPKMSARQAYEICEAVASSAALSAGNSRKRDYYSTDCSSFSSNSWSCTTSRGSGGGGFAAGFFDAWSRELDRSKAKRIALRGCMAENGWSVRKK